MGADLGGIQRRVKQLFNGVSTAGKTYCGNKPGTDKYSVKHQIGFKEKTFRKPVRPGIRGPITAYVFIIIATVLVGIYCAWLFAVGLSYRLKFSKLIKNSFAIQTRSIKETPNKTSNNSNTEAKMKNSVFAVLIKNVLSINTQWLPAEASCW